MREASLKLASAGLVALLIAVAGDAAAQSVEVGGLAYIDYFYTLSSPEEDADGFHGFTYRRLYLTTDATLSDEFSARARFEAHEGTAGPNGPVPFVKDLWLAWNYSGDHEVTLGVMPTPAFEVADEVWGYRSLEKTVLNLQDVNDSRDFGVRFDGPLVSGGGIRYAVMLANNSASSPESDRYKRGYAQISVHPTDRVFLSVGAHREGYGDERVRGERLSAFGGYLSESARAGIEAYWSSVEYRSGNPFRNRGVSLFGGVHLRPQWAVVGRVDLTTEGRSPDSTDEVFVLVGLTYAPIEHVRIIPNIHLFDSEASDEPETLGRITVELTY